MSLLVKALLAILIEDLIGQEPVNLTIWQTLLDTQNRLVEWDRTWAVLHDLSNTLTMLMMWAVCSMCSSSAQGFSVTLLVYVSITAL